MKVTKRRVSGARRIRRERRHQVMFNIGLACLALAVIVLAWIAYVATK